MWQRFRALSRGKQVLSWIALGFVGLIVLGTVAPKQQTPAPGPPAVTAATSAASSPSPAPASRSKSVVKVAAPTPVKTIASTHPVVLATPTLTSAPTTHAPPPAPPTSAAALSCHPLTNGGNCYEPGEFCRSSDHGVTGLAGDGETITCKDNNRWRWEPGT